MKLSNEQIAKEISDDKLLKEDLERMEMISLIGKIEIDSEYQTTVEEDLGIDPAPTEEDLEIDLAPVPSPNPSPGPKFIQQQCPACHAYGGKDNIGCQECYSYGYVTK